MRYSARWMTICDERILERLSEVETDTPKGMADSGDVRFSRQYVGDCTWVPATETERQALKTTWMALRGQQFRELTSSTDRRELEQLREHPERAEILSS